MNDQPAAITFGGTCQQLTREGGKYVIEISRAAVVSGRDHGYLTRRLSTRAIVGCTCGWFNEGEADQMQDEFERHAGSHR